MKKALVAAFLLSPALAPAMPGSGLIADFHEHALHSASRPTSAHLIKPGSDGGWGTMAAGVFPAVATASGMSKRSYIVEFHEHAVQSAPPPKADRRTKLDPDGWGDVIAGVLSRVQEVEERAARSGHPFHARYPYSHVLRGFVAELSEDQVKALRADPLVRRIQADREVTLSAGRVSWSLFRTQALHSAGRAILALGGVSAVNVYVIDSGIARHRSLTIGRSVNFTGDGKATDCHGHGTHVAGIIGASNSSRGVIGMMPGVRLNSVKVTGCDGSGFSSTVLKGVDWVTAVARPPAVANISLTMELDDLLDLAVIRSVGAGIFYALAAGNQTTDACLRSPSRAAGVVAGAMTVAATDYADAETWFSNYGRCVDIWAPGDRILSTMPGGRLSTHSGTSMAAPHVAGAAALYLSRYPASSPAAVALAIRLGAVMPGTLSKDGRAVARLDVVGF